MGGQSLDRAWMDPIGLRGDRRWMVVTDAGRFVTRRELPRLAQIEAVPQPGGLLLRHAEAGEMQVAFPDDVTLAPVTVWRDQVLAQRAGRGASDYLAAVLGKSLHLAYMPDTRSRPVDPSVAAGDDYVSFADAAPVLLTTTESLAALNEQLPSSITMARFRANIVVSGASEAWAEDRWRLIRIGALTLRIVKPCARCVVTTQHPATGAIVDRHEPLATLRAMGRRAGTGIMFGQNAIPGGSGEIAVGDVVEILESGPSNLGLA